MMRSRTTGRLQRTTRRTAATVGLLAVAAVQAVSVAPASADFAPDAFGCRTSTIWYAPLTPTQLHSVAYSGGSAVMTPIGPPVSPVYNALGYNAQDGYLYGIQVRAGVPFLIRIANDGSVTPIKDLPTGAHNGTLDDNGNYYFRSGTNELWQTTVDPSTPTSHTPLVGDPAPTADLTFIGGRLWGESIGGFVRIDPATGQTDYFPSPVDPSPNGNSVGAAWTFGNGNLGLGENSTGTLYQVEITGPNSAIPSFRLVSSAPGPPTTNNDATACEGLPADLALQKSAAVTSVQADGDRAVEWTLTITNNGPGDSSGYTLTDTMPPSVADVATSSTGCSASGSVVTCIGDPLPAGQHRVVVVTGTIPFGTSEPVTNSATLTGNEDDPDHGNDTASATIPGDTAPPACALTGQGRDALLRPFLEVTTRDTGTGIFSIEVLDIRNGTVSMPSFAPGTTDPLVVRANGTSQAKPVSMTIRVTDIAGNQTVCDPIAVVVVRDEHRPVELTFDDIPAVEHFVHITNGDPGVDSVRTRVNGDKYEVKDLGAGESTTLDVQRSMRSDDHNTFSFVVRGKPGSTVLITISDS